MKWLMRFIHSKGSVLAAASGADAAQAIHCRTKFLHEVSEWPLSVRGIWIVAVKKHILASVDVSGCFFFPPPHEGITGTAYAALPTDRS